jgi:hypothetical protein
MYEWKIYLRVPEIADNLRHIIDVKSIPSCVLKLWFSIWQDFIVNLSFFSQYAIPRYEDRPSLNSIWQVFKSFFFFCTLIKESQSIAVILINKSYFVGIFKKSNLVEALGSPATMSLFPALYSHLYQWEADLGHTRVPLCTQHIQTILDRSDSLCHFPWGRGVFLLYSSTSDNGRPVAGLDKNGSISVTVICVRIFYAEDRLWDYTSH